MITALKPEEVLSILKSAPEQWLFDWKRDLNWSDEEKKAELLKDVVAIANATTNRDGYIFYGLDPRMTDPVVGLTKTYDDSIFQQFAKDKVDAAVLFLFYTVEINGKPVGVIHVPPSRSKPHIITKDIGSLRDGQIPIRRGSSTGGIRRADLKKMFFAESGKPTPDVLITALQESIRILANHYAETKKLASMSGDTLLFKWQIVKISLDLLPVDPSAHDEVNKLIVTARAWASAWNNLSRSNPILEFPEQELVLQRVGACLLQALIVERKLDEIVLQDGFIEGAFFGGYIHHEIGSQSPWTV